MSFHLPVSPGVYGAEPHDASRNRAMSGAVTGVEPRFTGCAITVFAATVPSGRVALNEVVGDTSAKLAPGAASNTAPMFWWRSVSPLPQSTGGVVPENVVSRL